jgi:signal transduction histidine kinase
LRAAASDLDGAPTVQDRLGALERALAIEQRELRIFITALGPDRSSFRDANSLARRLEAMQKRMALEWSMPVTVRCATETLPAEIEDAVPFLVHEAVVNALKHGHPSRVAVTVEGHNDTVRIVVADDGRGFHFHGRKDHQALAEDERSPRSLLDRVAALGGEVRIESNETGSRVEVTLPVNLSLA